MKKYSAILLLLLFLLLPACGGGTAESEPPASEPIPSVEVTPEPSAQPSEEPPVEEVAVVCAPLTGIPVEDETMVNDRPVAVMLNNLKDAMPQQGNSGADVIYEVVAEGGITRMLGVYQSLEDVGTIGSVRSARPYYIELALGHDAIFVHAGGSEEAYDDLSAWNVDNMDGVRGQYSYADAGLFWRERDRVEGYWYDYEHSLVTSGESILNALAASDIRLEHQEDYVYEMTFAEDGTPADGEAAAVVTVPYSNYKTGVFRYDGQSGKYFVEEYGQAYVDGNTGEQIAVTNVLVLSTSIRNSGDSYGHMEVDLTGGTGWFACGGKIIPITWEKGARDAQLRYYTADGQPLTLGQGKSYVNILSDGKEISWE